MPIYGMGIQTVKVYEDKNVFEAAEERMVHIFDICDTPTVSFSGGKDSTCLLHLALNEAQRRNRILNVVLFDEEIIDPDTEAYWNRVRQWPGIRFHWICVTIRHTLRSETRNCWYTWDPDERDVWFREIPPWAITEIPGWKKGGHIGHGLQLLFPQEQYGLVCQMAGIRVGESLNRRRSIMQGGQIVKKGKQIYAKPIYDWKTEDVWLAIHENGWDYSKIYDKMQREGVSLHEQRLAPWGNVAAARETYRWAKFYPEAWEKALRRLPELAPQARYGRSKIYRKGMEKPLGLTWQEWAFQILEALDEESQKFWRNKIRKALSSWAAMNSVPFPELPLAVVDGDGQNQGCWKRVAMAICKNDRIEGDSRDKL